MTFKSKQLIFLRLFLLIFLIDLFSPIYSQNLGSKANTPSPSYLRKKPKNNFYILGPGDIFHIEVTERSQILNGKYLIDGEGFINIKRLKTIYVSGLTIAELENLLNEEYKKYVFEPNVKINMITYRPIKLYIDGEIKSPGMYVLEGTINLNNKPSNNSINPIFNLDKNQKGANIAVPGGSKNYFPTLYDLIRESGGITLFSDLKNIKITRINNLSDGGGRIRTTINLLKSIDLTDNSQNIRLFDGDNIFIPKSDTKLITQITKAMRSNINPKEIKVIVSGEVAYPGVKILNKLTSLNDAIDISGGKNPLTGKIQLIRYNNDGALEKKRISYRQNAQKGSIKNPYLLDGDIVILDKGKLKSGNVIIKTITDPLTNLLSSYIFLKSVSDLND